MKFTQAMLQARWELSRDDTFPCLLCGAQTDPHTDSCARVAARAQSIRTNQQR